MSSSPLAQPGRPAFSLGLLGGLYFAQGIPWGFLTVALPLQLGFRGLGSAAIGDLLAVAWIPWTLKPLMGPLVDRVSFGRLGRKRPFLFLAQLGMAASLVLLLPLDPLHSLGAFKALVFLHNLFAAAQDVGTDALALSVLPPDQRGRGSAFMSVSKTVGSVVGGSLSWVGTTAGWPMAYVCAIVLLAWPIVLVVLLREPAPTPIAPRLLRTLFQGFAQRATLAVCVVAMLVLASDNFVEPMIVPFMKVKLGFSQERVAALRTLSQATGIAGMLLGGLLADRLGRAKGLVVGGVGTALTYGALVLCAPLWPQFWFWMLLGTLTSITVGISYTAILALVMDHCAPGTGATQFQIFMSISNLKGTWAPALGGRAAERFSPGSVFLLGGLIELLALPFLLLLRPRKTAPSP